MTHDIPKVVADAHREHPEFVGIDQDHMKALAAKQGALIELLEAAALEDERNGFVLTPEAAKRISVIWVFSGPSTYDGVIANERYQDRDWFRSMERSRLLRAALLAEGVALAGGDAPWVVYNGSPEQNSAVRRAVLAKDLTVPVGRIEIVEGNFQNTADQIRDMVWPEVLAKELRAKDRDIALISHAPHLARILHFLPRYSALPTGTSPWLFPVSTDGNFRSEYAEMELRAMLYYSLLAKSAAEIPHSYRLQ